MKQLRRDALAIFRAGLDAADAGNAVRRHFRMPAGDFDRVVLIAIGKAACPMARAVHESIGDRISEALVLTKEGHASPLPATCRVFEAAHPIPDEAGARASTAVAELATSLTACDLLIVAVSGGASALLSAPVPPVTLADKQRTTDLLLRAGANIYELNAVRKHLSTLKGGRLAAVAQPARVLSLLLSDVIGDPIDVIGSGPTAPDPTTYQDAIEVLRKFELLDTVPAAVRDVLTRGESESPKPGDPLFDNVQNVVVGSNRLALEAASQTAASLGYRPHYSFELRPG